MRLVKSTGNYNNSGMALLLVITVVSLLTVIILQFNREMRDELTHSHNFQIQGRLSSVVDSGLNLGLAIVHADRYYNNFDCLYDQWARVNEKVITDLGGASELVINITDLSGKFQLNSLIDMAGESGGNGSANRDSHIHARKILYRMLVSGDFLIDDDLQAREIVDSLVDWLDSDDNESEYGAENSYYQTLEKPYFAKNGLMDSPHELLAVKGITPKLLYGNGEKLGLIDYVTVYGTDGKVNLNTADLPVIRGLHDDITLEDAEFLVEYRSEEDVTESLGDPGWYKSVPGWPNNIIIGNDRVTVVSSFFKIEAMAKITEKRMTLTAYVKRTGKKELEILYTRVN